MSSIAVMPNGTLFAHLIDNDEYLYRSDNGGQTWTQALHFPLDYGTLTSHTVVAHVVGRADGMELARRVRAVLPGTDVGSVLVRPTEPTIANTGGEDPEGVVDLPRRRVASAGIAGLAAGIAARPPSPACMNQLLPIGLRS